MKLDLHVLVAEDNPVNRKFAELVLKRLGCRVDVVNDGRAALAAIERKPYDLVLMDVQMPEMDRFEATAELRRRELGTGRRLPVVAATAHAMDGDRERCFAAGMDDYVSKPLSPQDLEAVLARCFPAAGVARREPAAERASLDGA